MVERPKVKGEQKVANEKLSQDVAAARSAGLSYGKWKALQNEEQIKPKKVPVELPRLKRTCEHCGKVFYKEDRKAKRFCCVSCRESYYYHNVLKEKKGKRNEAESYT